MSRKKSVLNKFFGKLILFAVGMAVLSIGGTAVNLKAANPKEIKLEVTCGLDNETRGSRSASILAELTNEGEDFEGKLQVHLIQNEKASMYQKDVVLAAGEKKRIRMDVPGRDQWNQAEIRLVDKKEKEIVKKALNPSIDMTGFGVTFTGVLSDNQNSLSYLRNSSAKVIPLNAETLPDSSMGLDILDMLIINDFDTSKLSGEQYEAIKDWVIKGGSLVLGAGDTRSKTFGIFQDDFLTGKIGACDQNGVAELSFSDSRVITVDGTKVYHQQVDKNRGNVQIVSYDLGNPKREEFPDGIRLAENLLENLSSEKRNQLRAEERGYTTGNYLLYQGLSISSSDKFPTTGRYALILGIYIILVGPGLYIVLKKKDKRNLMWIIVPALALIFTAGIYVIGTNTRINEPYASCFSYTTLSDRGAGESITENYYSITAPYNFNYEIELNDKYKETFIIEDWNYGRATEKDKSKYKQAVKQSQAKTILEVKENAAFVPSYFATNVVEDAKGTYDYDLKMEDFKIEGSFTNHLGVTIKNAAVYSNNQVSIWGDIAEGETILANNLENVPVSEQMDYTALISQVIGVTANEWELEAGERREWTALMHYFQEKMPVIMDQSFMIGFVTREENDLMKEIGLDYEGAELVILPLNLKNQFEGSELITDIWEYGRDETNQVEVMQRIFNTKEAVIEYSFGTERIGALYFLPELDFSATYSGNAYTGTISALNLNTGSYDLLFEGGIEGRVEDLSEYLNEYNELTLRFIMKEDIDQFYQVMPVISAVKEAE